MQSELRSKQKEYHVEYDQLLQSLIWSDYKSVKYRKLHIMKRENCNQYNNLKQT